MNTSTKLPVAVIGAGPVGLAAAAHLVERGETPLVLEAGSSVGAAVRKWAHVRMFSPWRYTIDGASRRLLERAGWEEPSATDLPTGGDLVSSYLEPLATRTVLQDHIVFDQRVTAITRLGTDKVRSKEREMRPFVLRTIGPDGREHEYVARAVIDASGTWARPNPMGADGLHPIGEKEVREYVDAGIPDVRGARRGDFAGRTTLVVGSGHSAFNAVLDLLALKREVPGTRVVWAMRRASLDKVFGGGAADALPARGELGQRAKEAIASGALTVLTPFAIRRLARVTEGRVQVHGELDGREHALEVDRIIVATGFRPDLDMLREVRLELDPWLESSRALGPLIDPNLHSCGTVRPHGARELAHPEKDFFIVGMKSYGRAPTFLLATGYEQARSVVAALVGDHEAAARVELDLPETGVCSLPGPGGGSEGEGCCGIVPMKNGALAQATAIAATGEGCGCGVPEKRASVPGSSGGSGPVRSAEDQPSLVELRPAGTEVRQPADASRDGGVPPGGSGCCGGRPRENATACCALDETKKDAGEAGCGCSPGSADGSVANPESEKATACCG